MTSQWLARIPITRYSFYILHSARTLLASQSSDFTLVCQAKLYAEGVYDEWKKTLFGEHRYSILALIFLTKLTSTGILSFFAMVAAARRQVSNKRIEGNKVSELVTTALDQLRQQEMAHHTDPVTYREPFLSPLHLRDLVLRDEHSVTARKRLWDKVEHIVENNANVRVNIEEMQGDETRVWRWVGDAGRIEYTPKKERN